MRLEDMNIKMCWQMFFSEGLIYIESEGYTVKIAMKEKAICDSLSKWRAVRNINGLKELLFVDKKWMKTNFLRAILNL